MRFEGMVLTKAAQERLLGEDFSTAYSGHVAEYQDIAKAQHEADMAAEVACPCRCHGQGFPFVCAPTATNGPQTSYCICSGRGRVTLGRIVEADRGRDEMSIQEATVEQRAERRAEGTRLTVTVPEAAGLLGVGVSSAWDAVWSGQIRSFRIGRRVLVPRAEIDRLLGGGGQKVKA